MIAQPRLSRRGAFLLFAVIMIAWGLNWTITKTVVQSVTPLWTTAIRSTIATVALAAPLRQCRKRRLPPALLPDEWRICPPAALLVMETEHRVTREALKQAVRQYRPRTADALFRRLEDQIDDTVEPARFRQVSHGPEQARDMTIMAAGRHAARDGRAMAELVGLFDRNRGHISAETNRALGVPDSQATNDSRLPTLR